MRVLQQFLARLNNTRCSAGFYHPDTKVRCQCQLTRWHKGAHVVNAIQLSNKTYSASWLTPAIIEYTPMGWGSAEQASLVMLNRGGK